MPDHKLVRLCVEYRTRKITLEEFKQRLIKLCEDPHEKPKVPGWYSNEHDQGMGVPARCRCGGSLGLRPLGWTCSTCSTGYGRDD